MTAKKGKGIRQTQQGQGNLHGAVLRECPRVHGGEQHPDRRGVLAAPGLYKPQLPCSKVLVHKLMPVIHSPFPRSLFTVWLNCLDFLLYHLIDSLNNTSRLPELPELGLYRPVG